MRGNPRATVSALALLAGLLLLGACGPRRDGRELRVGVFLYSQHPIIQEIYAGFQSRLTELNTKSVGLEFVVRNADGNSAQANSIASFFRASEVDIVFAVGLTAAQALKSAGIETPVVFGGPPDPVAAGLVPRLTHHGTNFTGTRYFPPTRRILQVFQDAFPDTSELAVLHDPGEANSMATVSDFLANAKSLRLQVRDLPATNAAEIEAALRTLAVQPVGALFLPTDNLIYSNLDRVLAFAADLQLPVFNCTKLAVEKGALFSLATDYHRVGELSADIAGQILFDSVPPAQIDVLDIQEGSFYVRASDPLAGRLSTPSGYAREEVK